MADAPKYSYSNVQVIRVVDGDTIEVIVDLGFRTLMQMPLRLYGINTPERGQPGYKEATEGLRKLLRMVPTKARPEPRAIVSVNTIKPEDKYGRYLAEVFLPDGSSVVDHMLKKKFGVPYFGGAR